MRSLIASSIMRTGSISPARACAEPASNKIKKLDQLASPMTKNESASEARDPGGIIPLRWAASSRNPGRHYTVIPGRLRRNPQKWLEIEGGVISTLFQKANRRWRRWRLRHEK